MWTNRALLAASVRRLLHAGRTDVVARAKDLPPNVLLLTELVWLKQKIMVLSIPGLAQGLKQRMSNRPCDAAV